ncbi:hypothetical protein DVK85_06690 [Flavobacterium arcticum]|uniref:Uncharacterized protein n=1 Tax=Flavobacterium arcticum TaxID=1784713 RepID=A0A345HBI7_9FLAO|nr:hypothetical protein [Flavobacterium arcticum]AXG73947.1 hypothetical protein DVK85_06690 [Flavobacterium arcticum]KAF2508923.1 hypothetical protein E0W72_10175 [Flavobacterium arcticum]
MSLLLYINGQLVDLDPKQIIAQTKQINDLSNLQNRQTNYTNKFKLPKTATNLKILDFLTVPGNNSNVPYQKNECSLYSDTGECFVYKGWAVVTDGGKYFNVVVYDGIIDLYKAIEGKSLADLDLSDLQHQKNVDTIELSWTDTLPYKYILTDYNGGTRLRSGILNIGPPTINADYLVPSISVAWLWHKIFSEHNIAYSGSIFDMQEFKNLWITYPKGLSTGDNPEELFESSDCGYESSGGNVKTIYIGYNSSTTNEIVAAIDNRHLKVAEAGYYRIEVSGNIDTRAFLGYPKPFKLFLGKNAPYVAAHEVQEIALVGDNMTSNEGFEKSKLIYLNDYDSVCLLIGKASNASSTNGFHLNSATDVNVKLTKVNVNEYDFIEDFSGFSMRDFLTEVIQRFGLTLYKDKYSNSYEFLTLQEQLQTAETQDWSSKFISKTSEKYAYGNYSRRNWFKYNYNDKDAGYNDSYIDIDNELLAESKDLFKSKIYSPEKIKTTYLGRQHHVYKLWEKETEDVTDEDTDIVTTTTSYKPLDKRFYLLRAENENRSIKLKSPQLGQSTYVSNIWVENYWKLPFHDTIQSYYTPLRLLLQNAMITTAELYLTDIDIANFDFKKLYYIEQLAGYFIINKITNYIQGKTVKCELIKINFGLQETALPPAIKINKVLVDSHNVLIYFDLNIDVNSVTLQISDDNQQTWDNSPMGASSNPRYYNSTPTGNFHIRLEAGGEFSEIVQITIPSNNVTIIL